MESQGSRLVTPYCGGLCQRMMGDGFRSEVSPVGTIPRYALHALVTCNDLDRKNSLKDSTDRRGASYQAP